MDYSHLTKQEIIDGFKNGTVIFNDFSKEQRDDKDIVLEAVKQNGYSLYYASEKLRNDKDVVLVAVKEDVFSLFYASERLQNDIDILEVLEKVNINTLHTNYQNWYQEKMPLFLIIKQQIKLNFDFTNNLILAL